MGWENNKYYTVGAIVDYVLETEELPDVYWDKLLNWGLWWLRELHFDRAQEEKTCKLKMDKVRTVELPDDYVDWVAVGIQIGNFWKLLSVNNDMHKLPPTPSPEGGSLYGANLNYIPTGIDFGNYGGFTFFNFGGSSINSVGGGVPYKGHFQIINRPHGKAIQFNSLVNRTHVIVDYISDGFTPCKETVLKPYFANYIRTSILMEYEKKRPGRTESSIRRTEEDQHWAFVNVGGRMNDLDPQTLVALNRKYFRLTVKY
jgi:hypothetical protein